MTFLLLFQYFYIVLLFFESACGKAVEVLFDTIRSGSQWVGYPLKQQAHLQTNTNTTEKKNKKKSLVTALVLIG